MEEAIIIGAGPCGLSAAIELQKIGIKPLIIEKECIVNSIYLYPTYMQFFSTPELLEIGGYPFSSPNEKPTRQEALVYYRNAATRSNLRILSYHQVTDLVQNEDGTFKVLVQNRFGETSEKNARHVIVATGYFDEPNLLQVPGENLSKVSHYFRESHPYTGSKVAVIGGSNSAIDAALDLARANAEVMVIYRGDSLSSNIKPWVRPIFESMVNKERIKLLLQSKVTRITEKSIYILRDGREESLDNDFVLALTGFRPDRTLFKKMGATLNNETGGPGYNPETMETSIKGIYVAGVAASGSNANEVFIETGRLHGGLIARHIAAVKSIKS